MFTKNQINIINRTFDKDIVITGNDLDRDGLIKYIESLVDYVPYNDGNTLCITRNLKYPDIDSEIVDQPNFNFDVLVDCIYKEMVAELGEDICALGRSGGYWGFHFDYDEIRINKLSSAFLERLFQQFDDENEATGISFLNWWDELSDEELTERIVEWCDDNNDYSMFEMTDAFKNKMTRFDQLILDMKNKYFKYRS